MRQRTMISIIFMVWGGWFDCYYIIISSVSQRLGNNSKLWSSKELRLAIRVSP